MSLTVAHFVESRVFGGTERALLDMLAGLDRGRWRPVLFHHPEPGLSDLVDGARSLDVEVRAMPRVLNSRPVGATLRFVRELAAVRPAIFHAHLNYPLACKWGLVAATLARIPAVIATEQLFVDLPWYSRACARLLSPTVDRYVAVSEDTARLLRRTLRIPPAKIRVVRNGIPADRFDGAGSGALRAALAGTKGRSIVLTVARLDAQKGHRYLLEAATLVPEAVFVLAGDGPERAGLGARARELGIADRTLFLGHRHDIVDLLASCDVFVLPSLFEGLPLSVLEAMAAGKPVICSAIGGSNEAVIDHETGILVRPADPGDLAVAIRTVLSDAPLARRLAAAGKARVRAEFSAQAMVRGVTRIYEELTSPSDGEANGRR